MFYFILVLCPADWSGISNPAGAPLRDACRGTTDTSHQWGNEWRFCLSISKPKTPSYLTKIQTSQNTLSTGTRSANDQWIDWSLRWSIKPTLHAFGPWKVNFWTDSSSSAGLRVLILQPQSDLQQHACRHAMTSNETTKVRSDQLRITRGGAFEKTLEKLSKGKPSRVPVR